jgi:hypothetical protein
MFWRIRPRRDVRQRPRRAAGLRAGRGWYRKAAAQGDADAQTIVGLMYVNGHGASRDYTQALIWYRKAADQGNGRAQLGLGLMYANGHGVPQDYVRAHMWFKHCSRSRIGRLGSRCGQVARPYCNPYDARSDRRGAAAGAGVGADEIAKRRRQRIIRICHHRRCLRGASRLAPTKRALAFVVYLPRDDRQSTFQTTGILS